MPDNVPRRERLVKVLQDIEQGISRLEEKLKLRESSDSQAIIRHGIALAKEAAEDVRKHLSEIDSAN